MPKKYTGIRHYDPDATPWNSDAPWSDIDVEDLKNSFSKGDSIQEIAMFIQRTETEVTDKIKELGLKR